MKRFLITILYFCVLSSCANLRDVKMIETQSFAVKGMPLTEKTVLEGINRTEWSAFAIKNGYVQADLSFRNRTYTIAIDIHYTGNSLDITYVDSTDMRYNGKTIHQQYYNWIQRLVNTIEEANLGTLPASRMKTHKIASIGARIIQINKKTLMASVEIEDVDQEHGLVAFKSDSQTVSVIESVSSSFISGSISSFHGINLIGTITNHGSFVYGDTTTYVPDAKHSRVHILSIGDTLYTPFGAIEVVDIIGHRVSYTLDVSTNSKKASKAVF